MSKREEYGLSFNLRSTNDGQLMYVCNREQLGDYSTLQILNNFSVADTNSLITELENALSGKYYEQYFSSYGTEADNIELSYPNVKINDLTLLMQDMLTLLNEWLAFLKS